MILVAVTAVVALAAGWYVVERMPHDGAAATAMFAPKAAPQEVRSVRIEGDRLPLTVLESLLRTRVGDSLDSALLETDRRALRDALVARGHWAAEVAPADVLFGDAGGAHVLFRVEQGPIYKVREIEITGDVAGVPAVESALTLARGDDVSPQRLSRNVELLTSYLSRHGKPATVSVEATTDRAATAVDVRFVARRVAAR